MDTITLVIAIILMMLGIQYNNILMAIGALIVIIISVRSILATILGFISIGAIYYLYAVGQSTYTFIILGAVILLTIVTEARKPKEYDQYGYEDYGYEGY